MRIVVDAMGGDLAPEAIVEGAVRAAADRDVEVILVGRERRIRQELSRYETGGLILDVVDASEVIQEEEHPVLALRRKKASSLAVSLQWVKEGRGDALVSAGSTGAVMAGSLLELGRIPGVDRPALSSMLPTIDGRGFLCLDLGANAQTTPDNLVEFALMGSLYAELILGIRSPAIGLLNIGSEEHKGNELVKSTHLRLRNAPINFLGNIEGRDLFFRPADVVICDGFTGNVAIKVMEGMGQAIFHLLREEVQKGWRERLGGLLLRPAVNRLRKKLDASETGGAPLLGINGVCIKCHGNSNARAIFNGVVLAQRVVEEQIVARIQQVMSEDGVERG